MNTEHPTVELYFVFAFTHCTLRVYARDEARIKEVLQEHRVEFFEHKGEKCLELDTRVVASLILDALPKITKRKIKEGVEEVLNTTS